MAKKTKSNWDLMAKFARRLKNEVEYDSGIHVRSGSDFGYKAYITVTFDDRFQWDDDVLEGQTPIEEDSELRHWMHRLEEMADAQGWEFKCRTSAFYDSDTISDGVYGDCLAKLTLTCDYSGDYKESTTRRQPVKWKQYNEAIMGAEVDRHIMDTYLGKRGKGGKGSKIMLTCTITVEANKIEEALDELNDHLLNVDAAITDGNDKPNPEIVKKYKHYDRENDGDVDFAIYRKPGVLVNVQNT